MQITVRGSKTYELPKKPKWRKGPPPSIGWWPASIQRYIVAVRYWDGHCWSISVDPSASSEGAGRCAANKEPKATLDMEWTDPWW